MCGHYFFNAGLSKSAFSTYFFRKLVFWLSVFDASFVCPEIWIRRYIYGIIKFRTFSYRGTFIVCKTKHALGEVLSFY